MHQSLSDNSLPINRTVVIFKQISAIPNARVSGIFFRIFRNMPFWWEGQYQRRYGIFMHVYPAHAIIRNFFGSIMRKLSVTSSHQVRQFPGTSSRRNLSIAVLKSLKVA